MEVGMGDDLVITCVILPWDTEPTQVHDTHHSPWYSF